MDKDKVMAVTERKKKKMDVSKGELKRKKRKVRKCQFLLRVRDESQYNYNSIKG